MPLVLPKDAPFVKFEQAQDKLRRSYIGLNAAPEAGIPAAASEFCEDLRNAYSYSTVLSWRGFHRLEEVREKLSGHPQALAEFDAAKEACRESLRASLGPAMSSTEFGREATLRHLTLAAERHAELKSKAHSAVEDLEVGKLVRTVRSTADAGGLFERMKNRIADAMDPMRMQSALDRKAEADSLSSPEMRADVMRYVLTLSMDDWMEPEDIESLKSCVDTLRDSGAPQAEVSRFEDEVAAARPMSEYMPAA